MVLLVTDYMMYDVEFSRIVENLNQHFNISFQTWSFFQTLAADPDLKLIWYL